jgi:hypothetical protein
MHLGQRRHQTGIQQTVPRPQPVTSEKLSPRPVVDPAAGLNPFDTAFAAARREQEGIDPSDPGGGRFMFDRGDDRGPREFHTGRADDLDADDLEADLRAGLAEEAAKRKVDADTSGLDLTGEREAARRAREIADRRRTIEGGGTTDSQSSPPISPVKSKSRTIPVAAPKPASLVKSPVVQSSGTGENNIIERAIDITLPENDLSVVKNSINMMTQGADALVDGGVEVGGLLAQLLNLLLFSASNRGKNSDEINAVVRQLQGATGGKVFE